MIQNDLDYQPELEDEEESDNESIAAYSDDEEEIKTMHLKKRKRVVEPGADASAVPEKMDDDAEREKKKRIDAIWAEMNTPSSAEKSTKKPLDDISSSMNKPIEIQQDPKLTNKIPTPASSETSSPTDSAISTSSPKKPVITRPKSNLSALVSQYNIKTPKMNTLDKSKLDWQGYVDREGIREDLKYQNKDGYMEKVAFLQRVDDRRLQDLKAGQRSASKKK
ncbi:unnamed protein product [Umbelopsis vinacea]